MAKHEMIAVLIGQADEEYQKRFLNGFLTQMKKADMDVCVFSMYRKYQSTPERELGESNIYQLVNYDRFDGIVMLKDTIQTKGIAARLEQEIHDRFAGPVLVIEQESLFFDSVCTDGYSPIVDLIEHLILKHGYKDIAFLTGKEWHPHSKQRLEAYKETMKKHGLTVSDDRILYGDFWYKSGELCVEQLLATEKGLPEAIACANDQMAIGVCEELERKGYKVPEDVAVVGFDSTYEGQTCPVPLTSAVVAARLCGIYAADYIISKLKGREVQEFTGRAEMVIGPSCGCPDEECTLGHELTLRKTWGTELSDDGFESINNFMGDDLMIQNNLLSFLGTVYAYAYQIEKAEEVHLCLNSSWADMDDEDSVHCKNDGYENRILHAVEYHRDGSDGQVSIDDFFDVGEMLPGLGLRREATVYYFTPVFFEDECFGYLVVNYGDKPETYDKIYRDWVILLSRSLEALRRNVGLRVFEKKSIESRKFATVRLADKLSGEEKVDYDMVERILDQNLLTYHFQPIVRVSDGEIYSYEALMRSTTDRRISPLAIIRYGGMMGRLMDIERATFLNVLKIVEDKSFIFGDRKIFINSIPGVKLDESTTDKIDRALDKHAGNIVVELTEEAELSEEDLDEVKAYLRSKGIEIAVDDYGTGYSNVSNLLRYMPDYVKIDRSLLSDIQNKPQKQYFVREIIDFCHDNKIMALAEGVETSEELRMVIHLGADLIQGYYTARPAPDLITEVGESIKKEIVTYDKERRNGLTKRSYRAGRTVRVALSTLVKDGYSEILVGEDNPTCRDVTFTGTPGVTTDLHMHIAPNYTGVLTLENVYFSNAKGNPCIDLGENTDVTLVFRGENVLRRGGIRVQSTSRLVIEGNGDLKIKLDMEEYYGIGNDLLSNHGEIIFEQDGEIYIETSGKKGVCIGSGHGGKTHIRRGKFFLDVNSDECVGIGAVSGDSDLRISSCAIGTEFSLYKGVCIGSLEGNSKTYITKSSVKSMIGGNEVVNIGTVDGKMGSVEVENAGLALTVRGDRSTAMGSIRGDTKVKMAYTGLRVDGRGKQALVFGGIDGKTDIDVHNSDTLIRIRTEAERSLVTRRGVARLADARFQVTINDEAVDIVE